MRDSREYDERGAGRPANHGREAFRGGEEFHGRNAFQGERGDRPLPRRMRERENGREAFHGRGAFHGREAFHGRVALHGRGAFPGKKRRMAGFVIVCLLLAMNVVLLLELHLQVRRLDRDLDQVMGRMPGQVTGQVAGQMTDQRTDQMADNQTSADSQKEQELPWESGAKENVSSPTYGSSGAEVKENIVDYVKLCGLDEVDMPIDRDPEEVLVCLEELSQSNDQVAEIYKKHSQYPDKMLKALANNPEMADFVKNSLNPDKSRGKAEFSALEKEQDYPLFLQWDPRWGYEEYGDDNIGLSGCGPTCVSMAMYYLLRDDSVTPKTVAEYGMDNGYYVSGTGTAWALLKEFPLNYGISVEEPSVSERVMKDALDRGSVIICSMSEGDFTAGGHFVVIYDYDRDGFLINDSNCVARSKKKWDFSRLEWQIRHMWVYDIM